MSASYFEVSLSDSVLRDSVPVTTKRIRSCNAMKKWQSDHSTENREESDAHRLDPLMEVLLVHFNTEDDLANRITGFFSVFDADDR